MSFNPQQHVVQFDPSFGFVVLVIASIALGLWLGSGTDEAHELCLTVASSTDTDKVDAYQACRKDYVELN